MRLKLKVFRVQQNLTQWEFADKLGCNRSTYAAIENGRRDGRRDFWVNLQKTFAVPDTEIWQLMNNESEA